MNITSTIEILGYGTSEGATHAWDTRGRGRKEVSQETKDRQERAKASHVPQTKLKNATARVREAAVAAVLGGVTTPSKAPFDVLLRGGRTVVEVKNIQEKAKNDKITMHKASLQRKYDFAEANNVKKVYTVIIDDRTSKVYVAKGVGSFRLNAPGGRAQEVDSLKDLRNYIK